MLLGRYILNVSSSHGWTKSVVVTACGVMQRYFRSCKCSSTTFLVQLGMSAWHAVVASEDLIWYMYMHGG